MPPELQKQVDELAEQAVDDWIEQKHAHEVDNICEECGKPWNSEYHQGKECVPAMNEDEFDR